MVLSEIKVGDNLYRVHGVEKDYWIPSIHPYKVLNITGSVIEWSYGGNCFPHKVKFEDITVFKTLDEAKQKCKGIE